MPPKSLVESAFDTLHQHTSGYEGNPVFDIAMGHIKNFDWNSVNTDAAKTLAKNIGKGLLEKGVAYTKDFAKEYVGKGVGLAIAGVGMATGATETALAVSALGIAVGSAIDWAVEFFTGETFQEAGNEGYAPGDWVAVDVSVAAGQQQGKELRRRRRLVKTGVNVGVVSQRQADGYVNVQNVQTGENMSYAVNQLKKLPPNVVSKLESNPDLKLIHDAFAQSKSFPAEQMTAKTSTRVGDLVNYRGNTWRIDKVTKENAVLTSNGHTAQVKWDDDSLDDAWNHTTFQPAPGQEFAAFVTQGGVARGDWVWFEDETMNDRPTLGVVFGTKIDVVQVISTLTGFRHYKPTNSVERAQGFMGQPWDSFRAEVVEGNLEKAANIAPGKRSVGTAQSCLLPMGRTQEMPQELYGGYAFGETKDLDTFDTPVEAWEDDTRVEFGNTFGRGWQYAESEMSEEEYGPQPVQQNNSAILLLFGAAVLAYALTR